MTNILKLCFKMWAALFLRDSNDYTVMCVCVCVCVWRRECKLVEPLDCQGVFDLLDSVLNKFHGYVGSDWYSALSRGEVSKVTWGSCARETRGELKDGP